MNLIGQLASLLAGLSLLASKPPVHFMNSSQSSTYTNPVWPHDFPDPYIAYDNGKFYAFATARNNLGYQTLESDDLVHWKDLPPAFKPSWSDTNYWAPEVHPFKGKWYFIYSALDRVSKKRDIAIAVGNHATGPYKEIGKLVLGSTKDKLPHPEGSIDATLYFEGDQPYLLYSQEIPRSIDIVPLSKGLSHIEGTPKEILHPDRPFEKGITEAPTLVKHRGKYWLFYSSGWFQSYKRDACYQVFAASSNHIMGPYVKQDKPLVTTIADKVYSPGHQSVFELPSGEWWMVYHAWDASADPLYSDNKIGRTMRIDRLYWDKNGPYMRGATITPQPAPKIMK